MHLTAVPRGIARRQYAAARLPFTVLEERFVAALWGDGAFVRVGFEFSLGSLDRFAGWLLADEQIACRGRALMRRPGQPAVAGAPGTKAPARSAPDLRVVPACPADAPQSGRQDGTVVADQDREDEGQVRRAAAGLVVAPGNDRATAGDAQAKHVGEQSGKPARPAVTAGTIGVRFTLPAEVQARTVALCGEFNNWSAQDIRLERGDDGSWQATVALAPGRSYRYRYLLDGEHWENAWQADRYLSNPYGGTDSVIVLE